ncbi:DUF1090 domain-containing protein [Campylobacter jejuni]|nr:DUF1090 domain-containing protein [Campylobacter jejuni]MBC5861431.1 DUF1090 domain-containing protein [Campylobacter jejuni]
MLILLSLCAFAFGASECDKKIDRINKEISFSKAHNDTARTLSLELALKQVQNDCAKDFMFYDKKLKEQEVEKIEKELDALKEQKEKIKKEIKEYIAIFKN